MCVLCVCVRGVSWGVEVRLSACGASLSLRCGCCAEFVVSDGGGRAGEVGKRLPGCFFERIALPEDEVLRASARRAFIENALHVVRRGAVVFVGDGFGA